MKTLREALEFFASYGNVDSDVARLARRLPTDGQLRAACQHAVKMRGRSPEEGAAAVAIVEAFKTELAQELARFREILIAKALQ